SGEAFTRKLTGLQLRGVEKLERETQDNVIEAGAGLNTNGTFTPPANSWSLRSADFTAGCNDRGGATGALVENILNGLRLLDAKIQAISSGNYVILKANLSGDTTLTALVPAGYMLSYVIFNEKAGTSPVLDLGTTVGGSEILLNYSITASGLSLQACPFIFSLTSATTLYLNHAAVGSDWNGSTVDVYFVMTPVLSGNMGNGFVILSFYEGNYGSTLPPTETEIEGIIGAASDYTKGSVFIIRDTSWGTGDGAFVMSNGATWDVNSATFNPAL
ncbi:MAG: hypothetical protein WC998_08635, partial [Candidatus Paceibacterota bacterium]